MTVEHVSIEGDGWYSDVEGDIADCGCAELRVTHENDAHSFYLSGHDLDDLIRTLLRVRREIKHRGH